MPRSPVVPRWPPIRSLCVEKPTLTAPGIRGRDGGVKELNEGVHLPRNPATIRRSRSFSPNLETNMTDPSSIGVSRRNFIKGVIAAGAAASSVGYLMRATPVSGQNTGALAGG